LMTKSAAHQQRRGREKTMSPAFRIPLPEEGVVSIEGGRCEHRPKANALIDPANQLRPADREEVSGSSTAQAPHCRAKKRGPGRGRPLNRPWPAGDIAQAEIGQGPIAKPLRRPEQGARVRGGSASGKCRVRNSLTRGAFSVAAARRRPRRRRSSRNEAADHNRYRPRPYLNPRPCGSAGSAEMASSNQQHQRQHLDEGEHAAERQPQRLGRADPIEVVDRCPAPPPRKIRNKLQIDRIVRQLAANQPDRHQQDRRSWAGGEELERLLHPEVGPPTSANSR